MNSQIMYISNYVCTSVLGNHRHASSYLKGNNPNMNKKHKGHGAPCPSTWVFMTII